MADTGNGLVGSPAVDIGTHVTPRLDFVQCIVVFI